MGLDMYLNKRIYIGANYPHRKITGTVELFNREMNRIPIDATKVSEIIEQAGYWRKANAIHKWFVDNIQDGIDECQEAYLPKEKAQELLALCKRILKDGKLDKELAEKELPPHSGFFFGSTEIDDWYKQDIEDTIKILESLDFETGDYYYQSSW